jgi:hypothetical protein
MTEKSRSQVNGAGCLLLGHFAFSSGVEARTRLLEYPLLICHHATFTVTADRERALGIRRKWLGFDRMICFTPNDLAVGAVTLGVRAAPPDRTVASSKIWAVGGVVLPVTFVDFMLGTVAGVSALA